jgi:hypothetical protein
VKKQSLQYWINEVEACLEIMEKTPARLGRALYHLRGEKYKKTGHMWRKDPQLEWIKDPTKRPKLFADYCEWKWGLTRQTIDRYIKAYEVKLSIEEKAPMGASQEGVTETEERILRPLGKLSKKDRQSAWNKASKMAKAEGEKVSSRHTKAAVQEVTEEVNEAQRSASSVAGTRRTENELKQIEENGITEATANLKIGKCLSGLFNNENDKAKEYLASRLSEKLFKLYPDLMDRAME